MRNLERMAWETHETVESGRYTNARGEVVDLAVADAVDSTRLFTPEAQARLVPSRRGPTPVVEVTVASSVAAVLRLGGPGTVVLNFASARHVGGGWLSGANAQEESLCRSSALAATLRSQPEYYTANQRCRTAMYTDNMIFSGRVPFFRDDDGRWLDEPVRVHVVTCPAPNAGSLFGGDREGLGETLRRRARNIVAVASELGCETLILGAWGCGVFRNEPADVAEAFRAALREIAVKRAVFAILGPDGPIHDVFRDVLCGG